MKKKHRLLHGECQICHTPFSTLDRWYIKERKFCSKKCFGIYYKKSKELENLKIIKQRLSDCCYEGRNKCWIWNSSKSKSGYGKIKFNGKDWRAHRLSYWIHKGKFSLNLRVCHSCDNPSCINPDHLFVGTDQENKDDQIRKNRHPKGEKIGQSKLKNGDILIIREMSKNGISQQAIADKYGVVQTTISGIVRRKTWKHI